MTLEPGSLLNNRYQITKALGQGGMGAVYRARDQNLDADVAVKENFFVSDDSARQFQREAQLLFALHHDGLPRVIDHFVIQDQGQYLVMDYIEGKDASEVLKENDGPLDQDMVLKWAENIISALKYLHDREPPVIHRDIKPSNIKITRGGRAMLVDFGLAKEYDPGLTTTAGAKAFTPGFAPPEQYGHGRTDPRTDVYSFGATLYNLLTDKIPADGLQRAIGRAEMVEPIELNPGIDPHISEAIQVATAVRPEERFESIDQARAALFAPHTIVMPTPATTLGEPKKPRRSRVPLVIGGVALVAAAAGAGLFLTGAIPGFGAPAATETPVPTEVPPTATEAAPVVVPTDEPTETPAPTDTPEPTRTPLPTDVPTPAATAFGGGPGQIAFASEREGRPQIFLMDTGGENVTQLTDITDGACQPEWSPDGERLLFTSPCREKRDTYPNAAVYVMNADGSNVTPYVSRTGGAFDADWSEHGILVTFISGSQASVGKAPPAGGAAEIISASNAHDLMPSWAPGGERVAMVNTSRAGGATIYWVFEDGSWEGSNPEQVTRGPDAEQPAWSPIGDVVAYVSGNHLWVIPWDSRGFGAIRLTNQGPNDTPAWSPDGQWIVFETWRDAANHDIYIMTANGGNPTRLTTDPAWDYHPAWRP